MTKHMAQLALWLETAGSEIVSDLVHLTTAPLPVVSDLAVLGCRLAAYDDTGRPAAPRSE